VHIKYFIHQKAKILISIIQHTKSIILSNFCNLGIGTPPILGFGIGENGGDSGSRYCNPYTVPSAWRAMPLQLYAWTTCWVLDVCLSSTQ